MKKIIITLALIILLTVPVFAVPKYSADVPKSIMTPDVVETDRLGTLEFFDGMPSKE